MKQNKEENFFKKKGVAASFAVVALAGGFLFINKGITGNIILSSRYSFSLFSIIGLLLVVCSAILGAYSIWKK